MIAACIRQKCAVISLGLFTNSIKLILLLVFSYINCFLLVYQSMYAARIGHFCSKKFSGRSYPLVTWLIFGSRAFYAGSLCWHLVGGPHPGSYLTDIGLRAACCTHDYRPLSLVGNEATTKNLSMVGRSLGQDSNPVLPKRNINICVCVCVLLCRKLLYSYYFLCEIEIFSCFSVLES